MFCKMSTEVRQLEIKYIELASRVDLSHVKNMKLNLGLIRYSSVEPLSSLFSYIVIFIFEYIQAR